MKSIPILAACLLSSCALYPIAPEKTPDELVGIGGKDPLTYFDLTDTRDLVRGTRIVLYDAAKKRRNADFVMKEITYYGTLVLVGGSLKESIAARNVGGGAAALASSLSGHYGISAQRTALVLAGKQADCIEEAIRPIAPEVRVLFGDNFEDRPDLRSKFDAVPNLTFNALRKLRDGLEVSLAGITLGTPDAKEISDLFEKWTKEVENANKKAKGGTGQETKRATAAVGSTQRALVAVPDENTCAPESAKNKQTRHYCAQLALSQQAPSEQADRKRQFEVAVDAYEKTLQTCFVVKQ